jgi:hypothetical protein
VTIALNPKTALDAARARVICANTRVAEKSSRTAGHLAAVLDARPESSDHTPSRPPRLKLRSLPFLFYATHPPEDVTTVRGALIV